MKPEFDLNTILYTIAFLIPGFIFYSARVMVTNEKVKFVELSFLSFVTYSFFNLTIFLLFLIEMNIVGYGPKPFNGFSSIHPILDSLFTTHPFIFIISGSLWSLVIPFIVGMYIGNLSYKGVFRDFIGNYFHIQIFDNKDTSWEVLFSNTEEKWLSILLKDNTKIYGFWGLDSSASSNSQTRDIFITQLYEPDSSGNLQIVNNNKGIWISGDEIKSIEVLNWD